LRDSKFGLEPGKAGLQVSGETRGRVDKFIIIGKGTGSLLQPNYGGGEGVATIRQIPKEGRAVLFNKGPNENTGSTNRPGQLLVELLTTMTSGGKSHQHERPKNAAARLEAVRNKRKRNNKNATQIFLKDGEEIANGNSSKS